MAKPTDRIQVVKQESTAGGGDAADTDPFYANSSITENEDALSAAGVFLQIQGSSPDEAACIWRESDGNLYAIDATNTSPTLLISGGISAAAHATLQQAIHLVNGPFEGFASGAYRETTPSADPFPTAVIWYTASNKVDKIIELNLTYNANKTPATEVWKIYDTDGSTVLFTFTDTISYSGVFETNRTRVIT